MKKIYKRKSLRRLAAAVCGALVAGTLGFAPVLYAHPILDSKDAAVSIATNGNVMNITSTAQDNLIKWVDFSISSGKTVDFHDKNYLNYVTGSAVSDIQGILKGTGDIYLVNPNGILIGDGATINVGNLYLSTKNLTDAQLADYSAAKGALFKSDNAALGDVINMGKLNANSVTVEGKNITFKNVADVTKGGTLSGGTITGGTVHNDSNVNLTANSDGEIHIGSDTGGASGYNTNGHAEIDYQLVSTAAELQAINNDLDGNYMLAGDINMSGVSDFTPIGKDSSAAFTGRFDGLSYEIQNLVVNKDNWTDVGLFGDVKNATIENLRLVGGSIDGDESFNVGGIIGNAGSSCIRNVWHTGTVKGQYNVGGIVGSADDGTVIENAYNTGTVTGQGKVGGIVGYSYSGNNKIKNAYNTGNVTATNVGNGFDGVGGIAGFNHGSIENAYNTGKVTGNQLVGGIAGKNYGPNSGEGQISHVYNTGEIVGTGDNAINIGGVVGLNTDNNIPYAKVSYAYNSGKVTGKDYVGGIVGKNYDYVEHAYNDGNVTGTSNANGIIGGLGSGGHAATDTYESAAALFAAWGADTDGTNPAAAWRRYGDNLPILTAFLTRKDNITSRTEYNGGADVGATYTATKYSRAEAQDGFNYIKDVSIVTPKELTVSFGASPAKTYDGTTEATAGTATLDGIVNSDAVSLADGVTATYTDKNAGADKTVNYSGLALTGDRAKNYNLVNAATAMGKGTITAKKITATFADISKTYDGTTSATAGAGTLTGVIAADTGKVNVTANAAYNEKNAGNRTVNYTNVALTGEEAGNYTIAGTTTGAGVIHKADVTISVENYSRAYDGTTSATGAAAKVTSGQLFGTDAISGGTFAFTDGNAGTGKTVTVSGVTITDGNGGNNYNVTYQSGTGEITRKALSLEATPQTITEGAATPTEWSGSVTGFVADEGLGANDTLSFALDNPEAAAVGSYKVTGTLNGAESGNYGENYTFANAAANATAFTIAAKYVPPAPTPTPSAPSGGNGGNTGNTGGNTGSTTPTNPTTPTVPTPIAPSGNTDSTTPNSGGNTSGTGANTPAPLVAAEPVIVATVTETETIAAAATAGVTAEMTHIADNVRPTNIAEQPANSGGNAAAAAVETAANAQGFTMTAGGLLAVSNETNSAPKDAMSVESIGHALSVLQHGSGEKSAATAPNTETKSAAGSIGSLEEAVEATDLAIGTEIAETDRESGAGQENLASDTGTAGGADESAEESDEKKKR